MSPMTLQETHLALVERLFDCFNRRDEEGIVAVCDERLEFFPVGTAEALGRDAPYSGPGGLRDYLGDVARVWEELRITPTDLQCVGDEILVRGRVYARSRDLGIRDIPVAWIWEVREDRVVRGEVFTDPEQALSRLGRTRASR